MEIGDKAVGVVATLAAVGIFGTLAGRAADGMLARAGFGIVAAAAGLGPMARPMVESVEATRLGGRSGRDASNTRGRSVQTPGKVGSLRGREVVGWSNATPLFGHSRTQARRDIRGGRCRHGARWCDPSTTIRHGGNIRRDRARCRRHVDTPDRRRVRCHRCGSRRRLHDGRAHGCGHRSRRTRRCIGRTGLNVGRSHGTRGIRYQCGWSGGTRAGGNSGLGRRCPAARVGMFGTEAETSDGEKRGAAATGTDRTELKGLGTAAFGTRPTASSAVCGLTGFPSIRASKCR